MTISSGAKLPSLRSTPILFLGRSLMWPTEASTVKSFPRYLLIVFAFAGDSTITSDLLISFLKPDDNQGQQANSLPMGLTVPPERFNHIYLSWSASSQERFTAQPGACFLLPSV